MAFSFGLLAKGLVGVLSVGTPIVVGVYYKDEILGKNKSKEEDGSKAAQAPSAESTGTDNSTKTQDSKGTSVNGEHGDNSSEKNPTSQGGTIDNNSGNSTQKGSSQPSQNADGSSGTGNS